MVRSVLVKITTLAENVICVELDSTTSLIVTPALVTEKVLEVAAVMWKLVSANVNLVSMDATVANVLLDIMVSLDAHYVNVKLMDVLKQSVIVGVANVSVNPIFKEPNVTLALQDISSTPFAMNVVALLLDRQTPVVMTTVSVSVSATFQG